MLKRVLILTCCVALSVALASCSSVSGTPSQKVSQWTTEVSLSSVDAQINTDLSFLKSADRSKNLRDIQTDCEGFPGDVEQLYETLPSPDTTLTNELNNATQSWFSAAHYCADAHTVNDVSYRRYISALSAGNSAYALAKKRLSSFGVK